MIYKYIKYVCFYAIIYILYEKTCM
ncbi:Hypothetical protein CFV354_1165 [Campylobacter fetus subsp. venerealis NCTC 10354]|nr:Hypothetical protein CFV354_1165 [Campylobacter fetus subsp. venerealis NCTC 10354]